jgi:hypothetical protein
MCVPNKSGTCFYGGTRWRIWLRHCTTSRKVACSIPDVVKGIFHWHNSSGRTMALGLTQPLTEMSTRNVSCGRCVGLTTLASSCADCLEIWEPQLPRTLRACPGRYRDCFSFTFTCLCEIWGCLSSKHKHHCSSKCDTVWVCTALFFMLVKSDFTSMKIKAACSSETSLISIRLQSVLSHEMPIFQTHGRYTVV